MTEGRLLLIKYLTSHPQRSINWNRQKCQPKKVLIPVFSTQLSFHLWNPFEFYLQINWEMRVNMVDQHITFMGYYKNQKIFQAI